MQLSFGSPSYIVGSVLQLDILLANPFCQCVDGIYIYFSVAHLLCCGKNAFWFDVILFDYLCFCFLYL